MEEKEVAKKNSSTLKISLNAISEATKKSMLVRIITSFVLAIIVIPPVILGGWYFITLIFVALIISVFEIVQAVGIRKNQWYIYILAALATIALTFWMFVKVNITKNIQNGYEWWQISYWVVENGFDVIQVSSFLLATILVVIFILIVIDRKMSFNNGAYLFFIILFAGFAYQSFLFIRLYPQHVSHLPLITTFNPSILTSSFLLLYVIIGTIMTDIGAYFIGVLFGKNKMIPHISPNKTWEGFVGGIFFSIVSSFLFAMIASWAGNPILPSLGHDRWYYLLLISVVMPFAATIGDLFFSATKRYLKVKDYGFIIPGHGGILDRVDSLLLVSVVTAMLVILINNDWSLLAS